MAIEIERKFLLRDDGWRAEADAGRPMIQGYIDNRGGPTVRVRLAEGRAFLTLKGGASNFGRSEFEYEIPFGDGESMMYEFCRPRTVEKVRYQVVAGDGMTWEIDEYLGLNAPLFTAEIELPSADADFTRPPWLGDEISEDGRYTNRALSYTPFSLWSA